jgi:hypothetical protein
MEGPDAIVRGLTPNKPDIMSCLWAIRTELVLRSGRFAVVAKGLPQFVANFLKKLVSFQWRRSCSFATFSVRLTISWLNLAAATRSTG